MKTFAIIDIGSNSVRLMYVADGKVLYKAVNTTRLGEGLADSPYLKGEAIERSANAVWEFVSKAKQEGAEKVAIFATAAVRSAKNRGEFLSKVKALCGMDVDVISGEKEAEIGILGALGEQDGGVIDIGGASTEIVIKESGKLIYQKSINVGVVRLKDAFGRDKESLFSFARKASIEYGEVPNGKVLYAIGGTATTLGAIATGLEEYSSEKVTGAEITLEQMRSLAEEFLSKSVEEIAQMPCMPKGRADVIAGGAVLFQVLMERLGIEKIIVSDRDNLEGYAIKLGWMK